MRWTCLSAAGLENGGENEKRHVYSLKELIVTKEKRISGYNCKELDFTNDVNELRSALFQSLRRRSQLADALISVL